MSTDPTVSTDRNERLRELGRELRTIDPDVTYFAATLTGDDDGWRIDFQSRFAGWPEGGGPHNQVELREAAPILTDVMTGIWDHAGEGWIAVTKPAHLMWFLRMGGNALISEELARKHYPASVEPREFVPNGAVGFVRYDPDARETTHRAPTPKQRTRVLARDGRRCQVCGERPSDNPHVTLHVHHIRPFGLGGLTTDENLITLCHTCHIGLDPHEDITLFFLPGGHLDRALEKESSADFREGVACYRRNIAPMFEALGKRD